MKKEEIDDEIKRLRDIKHRLYGERQVSSVIKENWGVVHERFPNGVNGEFLIAHQYVSGLLCLSNGKDNIFIRDVRAETGLYHVLKERMKARQKGSTHL